MKFIAQWDPKAVTTDTALIQITAGADRPVFPLELLVAFDGVTPAQTPIEVFIARVTVTGAASSHTPLPLDERDSNSIQATCLTGDFAGGTEPTWGDILFRTFIHAQTPPLIWRPAEPDLVVVDGGSIFGVGIIGTISPTLNVLGYLHCRE